MPKTAGVFHIYLSGLEQGFLQGFDYKNVPAVPGIYLDFTKRKVNIPAIPTALYGPWLQMTSA